MPQHERLLELLRERSFARKKVILASGKESDFFIDCKQTVLTAEGHHLVGMLMLSALDALVSHQRGEPRDAVYVRKEVKDHGSKRALEGDTKLAKDARIAILEDVTTTGGSTLKAAEKIRAAGYEIAGVITLVDRLEGGREAIEAAGLKLVSIYTRRDFITD